MYLDNCDQVCQHSDLPAHVMITSQWLHLLKCGTEIGHFEGRSGCDTRAWSRGQHGMQTEIRQLRQTQVMLNQKKKQLRHTNHW